MNARDRGPPPSRSCLARDQELQGVPNQAAAMHPALIQPETVSNTTERVTSCASEMIVSSEMQPKPRRRMDLLHACLPQKNSIATRLRPCFWEKATASRKSLCSSCRTDASSSHSRHLLFTGVASWAVADPLLRRTSPRAPLPPPCRTGARGRAPGWIGAGLVWLSCIFLRRCP